MTDLYRDEKPPEERPDFEWPELPEMPEPVLKFAFWLFGLVFAYVPPVLFIFLANLAYESGKGRRDAPYPSRSSVDSMAGEIGYLIESIVVFLQNGWYAIGWVLLLWLAGYWAWIATKILMDPGP